MLWYDMFFGILLMVYMFMGYLVGFLKPIAGLIGLFVATFIAGQLYLNMALFVVQAHPEYSHDVAKVMGFFGAWVLAFVIYAIITTVIINAMTKNDTIKDIDKGLGLALNFVKGVFIISLVFWVVDTYTPESWADLKEEMQTKSLLYHSFQPVLPAVGSVVQSISNVDWSQPIKIPDSLQNKTQQELNNQGLGQ